MKYTNLLVSIEGVDGSGKTSLVESLEAFGYQKFIEIPKHIDSRVAEQDELGYKIRKKLRENNSDSEEFRIEMAYLFTEYRLQYQRRLYLALEESNVIIDRGILSTMVYGYSKNEEANSIIANTNLSTMKPDVTIYLDIDKDTAIQRLKARGGQSEVYKSADVIVKNIEYFNLFIDKYREELNIVKVNAMEDKKTVLSKVLNILEDYKGYKG